MTPQFWGWFTLAITSCFVIVGGLEIAEELLSRMGKGIHRRRLDLPRRPSGDQ